MITWTLLCMAAGYFVFAHASTQKGDVKTIGRIVGLVIMALSLIGVACSAASKSSMMCNSGSSECKMMKSFCPIKHR